MRQIKYILIFFLITYNYANADINKDFEIWKNNFKKKALENNISVETE